ncbi:aldehyde dehydrogenase family protein [Bacillus timonensis]|nr:aldehyde dehydrogenase family protein [Bacillus timonensis]
MLINGEWIEGSEYKPLYSPFSGEKIADIPVANLAEIEAALQAADCAKKIMAKLTAHERSTILENLVKELKEHKTECARLISLESAKPMKAAIVEVDRTIMTYTFAAEEARRMYGETIPMDAAPGGENRIAFTKREPIGVIAAITPFNFPMNLVAHKIGPAIASGNCVVLKPASQTPLSALFLGELLVKAGLPNGAVNIITGSGSTIGDALITDSRVKAVTFTGSPEVGKAIKEKAGLRKVTLELGSNSALIVDHGVNVEEIIPRAVTGSFSFSGQVCISLQRIYVHQNIFDEFVEKFLNEVKKLNLGDPFNESTDVSSLISKKDVERTKLWVNEAIENGAVLACGGTERKHNILEPTVLLHVSNEEKVSCQEVFAPVVLINKISSLSEGIKYVNQSQFGLQAGVYTNDLSKALMVADELEVGGVMINDIPTFRVDHMPYGGVKESGTGREGIKYAIEEMTEMKLICIKK